MITRNLETKPTPNNSTASCTPYTDQMWKDEEACVSDMNECMTAPCNDSKDNCWCIVNCATGGSLCVAWIALCLVGNTVPRVIAVAATPATLLIDGISHCCATKPKGPKDQTMEETKPTPSTHGMFAKQSAAEILETAQVIWHPDPTDHVNHTRTNAI